MTRVRKEGKRNAACTYRKVPCDFFFLSFFFFLYHLSEQTELHFSRFNSIFFQMIARTIGYIFFTTNFCWPVSKESERGRKSERECRVALFFVLAVAGREIVLHARIASKRRRLHRGKGEKMSKAKKEGKRERRRRREWRKMEAVCRSSAGQSAERWYSRRREPRGTDGGAGGGKVGLAAENQLAIALSRRSAMRWFEERVWRNGERPTESGEFRRGRVEGER